MPLTFITPPASLNFNSEQNFEFYKTQPLPSTFPEKSTLESGDWSELNQINNEFYNELPYSELVSSRIVEYDEFLNRTPVPCGPWEEKQFTKIEEKMVIFLTLKVLQVQQVAIADIADPK